MAELATIARPYAEALFKAVGEDAQAAVWIDELAEVASNDQLKQFAENPKVTSTQVYDLISGVMKASLSDKAKNFVRLVVENGRLDVLPDVAAQFRQLLNQRHGCADAVVYSAFPMAEGELADLRATLEARFGRKLNLSVELAPELIGGIRVAVGDEVLDASVKARLEQMKSALTA